MRIERLGRVELVLLLEVRPLPPERPGDQIGLAVVVEVAERRPFGKEAVAELVFLNVRNSYVLGAAGRADEGETVPATAGSERQIEWGMEGKTLGERTGLGMRPTVSPPSEAPFRPHPNKCRPW